MLMRFTGYPRLGEVAQKFSLQVTRARILLLPSPGRMGETLQEHRDIYQAIQAGDAQAAKNSMRHHLGQFMPRIVRFADTRPELFRAQ